MICLINEFESDFNVRISPATRNFWCECPEKVITDIRLRIKNIQLLMSNDEKLFVVQWLKGRDDCLAVLFVVTNSTFCQEDRFRFMLSFHVPEFKFYSAKSITRSCVVKDKKWQDFAEHLIGFRHGLDE